MLVKFRSNHKRGGAEEIEPYSSACYNELMKKELEPGPFLSEAQADQTAPPGAVDEWKRGLAAESGQRVPFILGPKVRSKRTWEGPITDQALPETQSVEIKPTLTF